MGRRGKEVGGERWGPGPQFVSWQEFPHNLSVARVLQRMLRGPDYLRCLPTGNLSLPTPSFLFYISSPFPPPAPPFNASCITFCVGGMEHASILGADSLFPALVGVKIIPRWHCSGPRRCTSKNVFLLSSLPTLHFGVGGATSKEKTPYGQGLCRSALVGTGIRKLAPCLCSLLLSGAGAVT